MYPPASRLYGRAVLPALLIPLAGLLVVIAGIAPQLARTAIIPASRALHSAAATDEPAQQKVTAAAAAMPLMFEENVGQAPAGARFVSRGRGYALSLSGLETSVSLRTGASSGNGSSGSAAVRARVRTRLVGANPHAQPQGEKRLAAKINYFIGNDPKQWRTDVPAFERVRTASVYPGIDLVHYGRQSGSLEYDFIVAPGADPGQIRYAVEGADAVAVADNGDLVVATPAGEMRHRKPVCFQDSGGVRTPVAGEFVLAPSSRVPEVSFRLAAYDPARSLVIDPEVVYSTLFPASSANGVAVDANGRGYIVGGVHADGTENTGPLPLTPNAFQDHQGFEDAYVAGFDPTKSGAASLIYCTYLGGTGDSDEAYRVSVDGDGKIFVMGHTTSTNFPRTEGPYGNPISIFGGAFLTVLDPALEGGASLLYSTFFQTAYFSDMALDDEGRAYIVGRTEDPSFPTTFNAMRRTGAGGEGVLLIMNPGGIGGSIAYGTFLGGSLNDDARGVAVDQRGYAYITGSTSSTNFPTSLNPYQSEPGDGKSDAFAMIVNPDASGGAGLIYSTYLGGSDHEFGTAIAPGPGGRIYVTGSTDSSDFPTTPDRFAGHEPDQSEFQIEDGFFAVIDPLQTAPPSLVYATYLLDGELHDRADPDSIVVDDWGRGCLTGSGIGGQFVMVLDPAQSGPWSLYYRRFLGNGNGWSGIAKGANGWLYVATGGHGFQPNDFPITPNAYQGLDFPGRAGFTVLEIPRSTAPTNLTATAVSSARIDLTWADNSNDENGFRIERKDPGGDFQPIATVAANVTSYPNRGLTPNTSYTYQVRHIRGSVLSGATNRATATTFALPAAPSDLTATTVSSTRIDLAWKDNGTDEGGVRIERKSGTGDFAVIGSAARDVTTYVNTGLVPNTTYTYRLRAYRGTDFSEYSNEATATTRPVPAAPTGLTAVAISSTQISLAWKGHIKEEDREASRFELERKNPDGTFSRRASVAAHVETYLDQGLTPETLYTYRVRVVNPIGASPYSAQASATTRKVDLLPPTNLDASALAQRTVSLFWEDNTGDESGFKLERSLNGLAYTQIKILPPNAVEATDTAVQPNTTYWYRVRAYRGDELSAYSNVVSIVTLPLPPAAPTELTAEPRPLQAVLLKWKDQSDSETRFRVEVRPPDSGFREIASLAANTQAWTTGRLDSNRTYSFRVRALNTGGFSGYSNVAQALTVPVPVKDLTVTVPAAPTGRTRLDLKWTDPNTAPAKARITRAKGGTVEKTVTVNAGVTTYLDTPLTPGTTYRYTIISFNASGEAAGVAKDGTTLLLPPVAPDTLTCKVLGATSAELKWRDRSTDEAGFKIERAVVGGAFAQVAAVAAGVVTWTDTRLSPATTYRFRLRAYRGTDHSEYSGEATGTTPPLPPTAPNALAAQAAGAEKVELAWADRSTNEDAFHIERAVGEADFAEIATAGAGQASFLDEDVAPATSYRYRVRAKNVSGFSPYSNIAGATTDRLVRGRLEVSGNLTFGGVKVGKGKALTLTLRNTSPTERLSLTIGTLAAPFAVVAGGGDVVLEPGGSRAVRVSFKPQRKKAFTARLQIGSSDPQKLATVIVAKGRGN